MLKNILTLLDLQQVDRQLFTLERAKGDLPRSLKEIKDKLGEIAHAHALTSARLVELQQTRHALENALSLARERKKKYESQLFSVKTNKEYDAITLEIENTEKEVDENETKILESLEHDERLRNEAAQEQAQITALEQERQQQEETLNRLLEQNKHQVEQLSNTRHTLVAGLEPGLLRTYDRIRRGKEGGEAVALIMRGACGGCGTRIPSQRIMEIRDMIQIFYCENCGRILVWQEEEAVAV